MSSTNPQCRTGTPRPRVAPPPLGAFSTPTGRRPMSNPRTDHQPHLQHPIPPPNQSHNATANRTNDLTSIMSGLSLAQPRPPSSSQPQSSTHHSSNIRKPTLTKSAKGTTITVSSSADDDDDDIQFLPTSTSSQPLSSSSYHSPTETKAALRALTSLVSAFPGPLTMAQVDAIQAILYPPTRPTESISASSSSSDDVLSDLAHITAFPGTRLARAAEAGDGDEDDNEPFVEDGDPTKARPVKPPGELLVKNAPGRSVAHRALAMKLAEHRRRKEEERNGGGAAGGSAVESVPGTPAATTTSDTPLRSSRIAGPSTPAVVAGGHGSVPPTDVKPSIIKREPVDTLDRVLLEVSAKTKAATGGPSKALGSGTGGMLGAAQPQVPGKKRVIKPVQPPTL